MQQREQKHQQDTQRQHQHRPQWHAGHDQPGQKQDCTEMQRQMRKPAPVGCFRQLTALLGCQAGEKLFVIHLVLVFRPEQRSPA